MLADLKSLKSHKHTCKHIVMYDTYTLYIVSGTDNTNTYMYGIQIIQIHTCMAYR